MTCKCYFKILGFPEEQYVTYYTCEQVQKARRKMSLLAHPDKHPKENYQIANRAQTLINQAYEQLLEDDDYNDYVHKGKPSINKTHSCKESEEAINFVTQLLKPKKPDTPPPTETEDNESDEELIIVDDPPSENKDEPIVANDEPIVVDDLPSGTDNDNSEASFNTSSSSTKSKRKRKEFTPTGYQLGGGSVIDSQQRTQGAKYYMLWDDNPHYPTWIHEKDLIKHFPEAAAEYMERLQEWNSRKLYAMKRKASPMLRFLKK